jgi:hypothetical protein
LQPTTDYKQNPARSPARPFDAGAGKSFDGIRNLPVPETKADHPERALADGKVSSSNNAAAISEAS